MKLELDLTSEEYEQLVECYFAGTLVLEEYYPNVPDPEPNLKLATKINSQADKFGKEHLVFNAPEMEDVYLISAHVENKVVSAIFGAGTHESLLQLSVPYKEHALKIKGHNVIRENSSPPSADTV